MGTFIELHWGGWSCINLATARSEAWADLLEGCWAFPGPVPTDGGPCGISNNQLLVTQLKEVAKLQN
ncbi:uncharacterized [Tachysurus ichikawai]